MLVKRALIRRLRLFTAFVIALPVVLSVITQPVAARGPFDWDDDYDDNYQDDVYQDDVPPPDPNGGRYISPDESFNAREYELYRRDMERRYRHSTPSGYGDPPYAAPVHRRHIKPKAAKLKPVVKPVKKTAKTTLGQSKKIARVSCDKGAGIVSSFGFANVATKSCDNETLVYNAERGSNKFEVEVDSASGELKAVKKL